MKEAAGESPPFLLVSCKWREFPKVDTLWEPRREGCNHNRPTPTTRFFYDRFADVLFAWNRWKGIGSCPYGATNSTLRFNALPASFPFDPTGARCATPAVRSRGAPMR
jgi:hypothetical protein